MNEKKKRSISELLRHPPISFSSQHGGTQKRCITVRERHQKVRRRISDGVGMHFGHGLFRRKLHGLVELLRSNSIYMRIISTITTQVLWAACEFHNRASHRLLRLLFHVLLPFLRLWDCCWWATVLDVWCLCMWSCGMGSALRPIIYLEISLIEALLRRRYIRCCSQGYFVCVLDFLIEQLLRNLGYFVFAMRLEMTSFSEYISKPKKKKAFSKKGRAAVSQS